MDSEVPAGWTKLVECELKVPAKLMENELMDCFTKLVKNELMDCLTKLLAKIAVGMTRKELAMNELMGSTANEEFDSRIAALGVAREGAGWRIAVVKTSASFADIASFASEELLLRKEGLEDESQLLGVAQELQAGELLLGKRLLRWLI